MRRHEPQARDRRHPVGGPDRVDRPDQRREVGPAVEVEATAGPAIGVDVGEARLRRQVVAVRVDVLAEQRDLAVAGGGDRAGLLDDLVERPAALRAAAERNDAVGARLVAAVDDRQPGGGRGLATDGAARDCAGPRPGQVIRGADERPPDDGRRPGQDPDRRLRRRETEAVDELGLLVGSEEQVDRREPLPQPGPVGLADRATGHDDAHPGVRLLEPRQLPLPADDLLLRGLPDRAGVDHDQVGRLERRRLRAARGQQPAGHLLGVAAVHLAAERPHVEGGQSACLRAVLVEALVAQRRGRRGRRPGHVEHGQLAQGHRPSLTRSSSATDAGTFSVWCASAYGMRSPW